MLSNAYFLAKFRFDTAESELAKNLQNFRKMHFSKMHFFCPTAVGQLGSHAPLARQPQLEFEMRAQQPYQ